MGNSSAAEGTSSASSGTPILRDVTDRLCKRGEQLLVHGRYHRRGNRLRKDYELTQQVLGIGISGNVLLARNRRTGQRCAVKSFDLRRCNHASLEDVAYELETMIAADHPNIVRIMDAYETDSTLSLVMECMEGGELFDRLVQRRRFEEDDAAEALRQMFSAVAYLHRNGIVHRDLKPENFLFEVQGGSHLKLTDFGFARYWDGSTPMTDRVGTPAYNAPEVIARSYTSQCDVWSLGVIAFMLIGGYSPFEGPKHQQMEDILHGRYKWRDVHWKSVSSGAIDFVKSLLALSPSQRPTANDALQNAWLTKGKSIAPICASFHGSVLHGLHDYHNSSKFRRACLTQIARSMQCTDFAQVRAYFLGISSLHDGVVYVKEIMNAAKLCEDFNAEEVCNILQELDPEQPISYTVFLAAMLPTVVKPRRSLLVESFCRFDESLSGTTNLDRERITCGNLESALGVGRLEAERLLADTNSSQLGKLSFADFQKFVEDPLPQTDSEASSMSSYLAENQSKSFLRAPLKSGRVHDRFSKTKGFFNKMATQFHDLPESLAFVVQDHPPNSFLAGGWAMALP